MAAGSLNSTASRAACARDNFTSCRVGNPAAVFDAASGGVVLAYVVRGFGYPGDGADGGEDAVGNGISISADGKTWGKPIDVSAAFAGKPTAEQQVAGMPGPGTALLLESGPKKGRLLVPSYHPYAYATVTVSDDHGATWRTTNHTFPRMGESALTQLPNGSVLMSMRRSPQLPRTGGRAVAVSNDGGDTFGPITYDGPHGNPICQGSIVSFGGATYVSDPAQLTSRGNLTIQKSTDNTVTWGKSLLVEAGNSAGYSCLVNGAIQGGGCRRCRQSRHRGRCAVRGRRRQHQIRAFPAVAGIAAVHSLRWGACVRTKAASQCVHVRIVLSQAASCRIVSVS